MAIKIDARRKVIFGGIQTAWDASASLVASSVLLTQNCAALIYQGDTEEITYDGDTGRDVPQLTNNPYNSLEFDAWVAGSGTAGTAPPAGAFLRMCGLSETVATGTSVTYASIVDQADVEFGTLEMRRKISASRHYLYRTINAVGQVGIDLPANGRGRYNFRTLQGDHVTPSDVASWTTPSYGTQKTNAALMVDSTNVPTLTIDSQDICAEAYNCPNLAGFEVVRNDLPNCEGVTLREVPIDATITFRMPDWTTELNPFSEAETTSGENRLAFSLVYGTAAGKILTLSSTETQLIGVQDATLRDGSIGISCTLRHLNGISQVWT